MSRVHKPGERPDDSPETTTGWGVLVFSFYLLPIQFLLRLFVITVPLFSIKTFGAGRGYTVNIRTRDGATL